MKLLNSILAAALLLASVAPAQEMNCVKPSFPACSFDPDVWMDEARVKTCLKKTEQVYAEFRQYQECLWKYRDDAIFLVDNKMAHMVAEMAAMRQFSKCRMKAGPYATRADIIRCPIPDFVEE